MAKVAIIGAGSIVFCQTLMLDILGTPGLEGTEFALMAPSTNRTSHGRGVCQARHRGQRLPAKVWKTTDRREALDGADYVIATFQVGGVQGFEHDYKIPYKYGVDQCIGDTLGPGGIFRSLRSIPTMLGMAQDIKEVAPEAYVLNYVNPMATMCWTLGTTGVKFVGLCHGVQTTLDLISGYVGRPERADRLPLRGHQPHGLVPEAGAQRRRPLPAAARAVRAARVLHQREGARRGLPPVRLLHDRVDRPPVRVRALVPHQPAGAATSIATSRASAARRARTTTSASTWPASTKARTSSPDQPPALPRRSVEYGSYIIEALETGKTFRLNGNVINRGMITNLPADCCAEGPLFVDRTGIHQTIVGDLPSQCAALNMTNINVQRLTVEAGMTGDPEKVVQACAMDPAHGGHADAEGNPRDGYRDAGVRGAVAAAIRGQAAAPHADHRHTSGHAARATCRSIRRWLSTPASASWAQLDPK